MEKLDALGQGVAHINGTISFIPKVLPGESGTAIIVKRSRGVQFAQVHTLDSTAEQRVSSPCVHYDKCGGCDYLHVTYEQELLYKKEALFHHLKHLPLTHDSIESVASPQRFAYRNRMQLHYRFKYLGVIDTQSNQVLEIPECLLPCKELQPAFEKLYKDRPWLQDQANQHGHCELYWQDDAVDIHWNSDYAKGGFSQVNEAVNTLLKNKIRTLIEKLTIKDRGVKTIIDLFSGSGNLSDELLQDGVSRVMVDTVKNDHPDYLKMDLFEEDSLRRFSRQSALKKADLLMVDPPRKGFALLPEWVKRTKPSYLLYISCEPATLARDLKALTTKMKLQSVCLLDMFPGTRHFETLVLCELRY